MRAHKGSNDISFLKACLIGSGSRVNTDNFGRIVADDADYNDSADKGQKKVEEGSGKQYGCSSAGRNAFKRAFFRYIRHARVILSVVILQAALHPAGSSEQKELQGIPGTLPPGAYESGSETDRKLTHFNPVQFCKQEVAEFMNQYQYGKYQYGNNPFQ